MKLPASFVYAALGSLGGNYLPPDLANRTLVLEDTNDLYGQPDGGGRRAIIVARATLRWDSKWVSAIGEAIYTYDPNRTGFVDDPTGVSDAVYLNPSLFGSTSSSRRASESTQRP
jgi:hypothetical protein